MRKYSNIWKLRDLMLHCRTCASSSDGKNWVPARPLGFASIGQRIRAARLVFTGKADAVIWEQHQ